MRLWSRLASRAPSADADEPCVPQGLRVYAIGDIHGRADLLAKLQETILRDVENAVEPSEAIIVYLGDYVDRGPDSKSVIDLVFDNPLKDLQTVFLKGNHEDALLRFLDDPSVGPAWFSIGGAATLLSYDVRLPEDLPIDRRFVYLRDEFRERIPEHHMMFLNSLKLSYELGDFLFVHAGIRPDIALDQQSPHDLMWIRDEFFTSRADHGKIVIHGHSPSNEPFVGRNRIGIDTGAFASNILTSVVLEGTSWRFLSTK